MLRIHCNLSFRFQKDILPLNTTNNIEPRVDSSGIQEPPTTLWKSLRQIGPGIILAGTIVGSGELVLTTAIGAEHGFVFLWLILFSCVIKVFVQIELGRYAISSGQPTLQALRNISRYRWVGLAMLYWWIGMLFCTVFQLGGMTGGVGQCLNSAFPSFGQNVSSTSSYASTWLGEYFFARPELPWAVMTCVATVFLIYGGSYRRIESLTTIIVVGVTLVTVIATIALFFTSYAPNLTSIIDGLKIRIPSKGVAQAFAVFGITGVGATELFYYPYWCIEKGYAKFVGPNDGSLAWETRAKGWIRIMHLDAWISMVVFTLSTVAFYTMGAAVLHPQELVPKGSAMINALSEMYKGPFGDWTQVLFLIGAGAVLFKTLYLSCAANSRMVVDFMSIVGAIATPTQLLKSRLLKLFCVLFPVTALVLYILQRDPQLMVRLGGMAQAATLPMMAFATLCFRYTKLSPCLRPSIVSDVFLWIASIAILVVAMY
ncbi:MAG: Nramp family divalent metal transporter, partial [Pirellula sp.]